MLTTLLLCSAVGLQAEPYVEKLPESTAEFKMVPIPGGSVKIADQTVEVKPFFMATTETTWDIFDQFLLSGEPSVKVRSARILQLTRSLGQAAATSSRISAGGTRVIR